MEVRLPAMMMRRCCKFILLFVGIPSTAVGALIRLVGLRQYSIDKDPSPSYAKLEELESFCILPEVKVLK
jgi:hypothetical protein